MSSNHNQIPRVITVDKNPAYPSAVNELKNDKILPINFTFRPPLKKENLIFLFRQFIANYTHYYVLIIQYSINVEIHV